MDKIKLPKRFYTKGEEPVPGKSINYYNTNNKLLSAMVNNLQDSELKEIRGSSLGVLLRFYEMDFGWASRLVHYFLTWQIVCNKPYEIWSLIGVTPVRFSLHEFEYITGLDCEDVEVGKDLLKPEIVDTEEIIKFWKLLNVDINVGPSQDELLAAMGECSKWKSSKDRVRLGYLALYATYIHGARSYHHVPVELARLVMDEDAWSSYPWGRIAFKNLIESVKNAEIWKYSYKIETGFVQVLQAWVYYSLPKFAKDYGRPLIASPDDPPLLHFRGSSTSKYYKKHLLEQVFSHLSTNLCMSYSL